MSELDKARAREQRDAARRVAHDNGVPDSVRQKARDQCIRLDRWFARRSDG
jgi:hypothetical protein